MVKPRRPEDAGSGSVRPSQVKERSHVTQGGLPAAEDDLTLPLTGTVTGFQCSYWDRLDGSMSGTRWSLMSWLTKICSGSGDDAL